MQENDLRYPIGHYSKPETITSEILNRYISDIEAFPRKIKQEIGSLTDQQLDTSYRKDGWTIRQVVNHCADSHMNAIIRLKLTLTEENPTIKPYEEAKWAELPDSKNCSPEHSLKIIEGVHYRWVLVLRDLKREDLRKTYFHPEYNKSFYLDESIGLYAWHCNHHLAHITTLKKRNNWE